MTASETNEKSGAIAVLPLGATEQHGPHLPFETDTIIASGIVEHVKKQLPESLDVRFLPVEAVGYSPEHMDFPGSKTLAYDEAINRWIGIGKDCLEQGYRRFVILNAHGGNSPLMTIVTTELRVRHSMLAVATSWTRFGYPNELVTSEEKAFGIHGGFIETSVMLALLPDLVNMEKAQDFHSAQQEYVQDFAHLRAYGPHAFGWKMQDLSSQGVVGNAGLATAQAGEAMIAHSTRGIIELLQDVARFDISTLR